MRAKTRLNERHTHMGSDDKGCDQIQEKTVRFAPYNMQLSAVDVQMGQWCSQAALRELWLATCSKYAAQAWRDVFDEVSVSVHSIRHSLCHLRCGT